MTFFQNIAKAIYQWVLNVRTDDFQSVWAIGTKPCGNGMTTGLAILLIVALFFVLAYYFVIASSVDNATKPNYLYTFITGVITLVVVNIVVLAFLTDRSKVFTLNMLKFNLIDILYFILLYEVLSLIVKDMSNASNIHLFGLLKSK